MKKFSITTICLILSYLLTGHFESAEADYILSGGVHASVEMRLPDVSFEAMWDSGIAKIDEYFHDGSSGGLLIWRDSVCDAVVDGSAGATVMPTLDDPVTPEQIAQYWSYYSIDNEDEFDDVIEHFDGTAVGVPGEFRGEFRGHDT